MNPRMTISPRLSSRAARFVVAVFVAGTLAAFANIAAAQSNQLKLVDILIALRSKKVSLPERNKIITEAIVARGVTFSLTPEIEKELTDTGADKDLLESIKHKNPAVKAMPVTQPVVEKKADPVPPPPDFSFYQKRAQDSVAKGDVDSALADFTKAIEMNPKANDAYWGRAGLYLAKEVLDLAIADLDKVVELKPDSSVAYTKRAEVLEKKGNVDKALVDYNKAISLDASNESAKTAAARIVAAQAKAQPKPQPPPVVAPAPTTTAVIPEKIDRGQLTKDDAVRMSMPAYSAFAIQARIGGEVIVDVTLDDEGKVLTAKARGGHMFLKQNSEDAALKSKFKPAMVNGKAIKSSGYIVYKFTPTR